MSSLSAFAHLDSALNTVSGGVSSVIPAAWSPQHPFVFTSPGQAGRRGGLEETGGHRHGEWRMLQLSWRKVIGLGRKHSRVICRFLVDVKGDEAQAELEADELAGAIQDYLANPTNGRGTVTTSTIHALEPVGHPTLSRVIPEGKDKALRLVCSIPYDMLHGDC